MRSPRSLKREDGAAAVEFAIVVSLLFMLVFGLIEYGFYFTASQNLRAGVREGARVAAVRGTNADIQAALVKGAGGFLPSGYSGFSVTPGVCTSARAGEDVTVTINNGALPASVKQAFRIEIPFIPSITVNPTLDGTFRCE